MAQLNITVDDMVLEQGEKLFDSLGFNFSTAFNVFLRQAIREGGIPFEITTDPFYSASNMRALDISDEQLRQGKVVVKTMEELEAMENE